MAATRSRRRQRNDASPVRSTRRNSLQRRRRLARRLILGATIIIGAFVWYGCSIERDYKTLSFFFDGVPDPNAPGGLARDNAAAGGSDTVALAEMSAHSAFVERRCGDCHGKSASFGFRVTGFSKLDSKVCLKCHTDIMQQYRYLHGPVAASACLFCHDPHESRYRSLLLNDAPNLCLKCHGTTFRQMQRENPIPQHEDMTRSCLDCHLGHGGDTTSFLRPQPPTPSEAPTETTDESQSMSPLRGATIMGVAIRQDQSASPRCIDAPNAVQH